MRLRERIVEDAIRLQILGGVAEYGIWESGRLPSLFFAVLSTPNLGNGGDFIFYGLDENLLSVLLASCISSCVLGFWWAYMR